MKPIVQFLPSEELANVRCAYRADDMVIECEFLALLEEPQRHNLAESINQQFHLDQQSDLLLIADTLTLTFSGSDRHLSGLDAYTNRKFWKDSKIYEIPSIDGRGFLVLDPTSVEGDRLALNFTPRYEQAIDQNWVRIVFREDETASHPSRNQSYSGFKRWNVHRYLLA